MGSKNKVKYIVGGVIVETDGSYENKFRVLRMAMDNWAKKNRNLPIDTFEAKQYGRDSDRYNKLKELFRYYAPNFLNKSKWFIKKKHMIEVNELYKRYNV